MATQKIRQDPDAPERQQEVQRGRAARRKAGVFVLVAALLLLVAGAVGLSIGGNSGAPATGAPSIAPPPGQTSGAFTVDLATGAETPLPAAIAGASLYAVSPDSTMVAFNRCCPQHVVVSVANIDGTGLKQVTPDTIDAYAAQWSPDGSSLVYQGRDASTQQVGNLYVVNVTTGATKQITFLKQISSGHWFMGPSFSPDGSTILFNQPRGDINRTQHWDLWSVPATGGAPRLVMRNAAHGAYDPIGTRIAYLAHPRNLAGSLQSDQLWTARSDGTQPHLLATVPVKGDGGISTLDWVRWSPDGTRIAMSGAGEVTIVDVATGATSGAGVGGSLAAWINDSSLIVVP